MTRKWIAVALLCFALAWPAAANAGLITWELEGTLEQVAPYSLLDGFLAPNPEDIIPQLEAVGFRAGAYWRARVTFDSDTAVEPCPECVGYTEFNNATRSIEFMAGDFAASMPEGAVGDALILPFTNGSSGGVALVYFAPMESGSDTLFADSAQLVFAPIQASLFPTTTLPIEAPDPAALVAPTPGLYGTLLGTHFRLKGHGFVPGGNILVSPGLVAQSFAVDGRITSIVAVPEPAAFALVLVAAAAIASRRRSRALP